MATFALRKIPTRREHDERVEVAAHLLGSLAHKYLIIAELRQKYDVTRRSAEKYISRARDLIRQRTGATRFEHRCEAESFYRSELQRSNEPMVRIKCRERLDWIHGVDSKFGGPAEPDAESVPASESAAQLSAEQVEARIAAGAEVAPESLRHLARGERMRLLRMLAAR